MGRRPSATDRILSTLTAISALVWLLVLLEGSRWSSPVTDYGAFVGLLALAWLIPLGVVAAVLVARSRPRPVDRRTRLRRRWAAAFLTLTWMPSTVPWILLVALLEPWPLSLRQGPDTDFARECFARAFRFDAPSSVSDVYSRRTWEFGDGNFHRLRFSYSDAAVVERVTEALGLSAVAEDELPALPYSGEVSWWPASEAVAVTAAYRAPSGPVVLWVDGARRTVYFDDNPFLTRP